MLEHTHTTKQVWTTMQETPCSSYSPTAYMLLLSAIDNGWRIDGVELMPSWDQHGFIYLVTLSRPMQKYHQRLILPKNPTVESLLFEQPAGFIASSVQKDQMVVV